MCFLLFLSSDTKTHSTGIGFETARQLYALGANIVLGCRSKDRAVESMRRIIGTDNYYTEDDDDNEEDDDNDDDDNRPKTNTKIITAKRREGADGGGVQNNNDRRDTSVVGVVGGCGGGGGRLYFVPLDLTSRASIHEAGLAFQKLNLPLHILINNAGVMRNRREVTEDGLEMTMAANVSVDRKKVGMDIIGYMRKSFVSFYRVTQILFAYSLSCLSLSRFSTAMTIILQHLGHFLLTNLLLPTLRATAMKEGRSSRVITISSSLHHNATRPCSSGSSIPSLQNTSTGWRDRFPWRRMMTMSWRSRRSEPGIDLVDLNCERKRYALFEQYAQTKLANVMFALELNRRESKFRLDGGSHDNNDDGDDDNVDDPGRIDDVVPPSDEGMRPISYGSDVNESYPQVVSYCVHPGLVRTDFV